MVNRYLALGYLSSNPEYKKFDSGKAKATFSIGINYGRDTTWVEVECWDKVADNANNFLQKSPKQIIQTLAQLHRKNKSQDCDKIPDVLLHAIH